MEPIFRAISGDDWRRSLSAAEKRRAGFLARVCAPIILNKIQNKTFMTSEADTKLLEGALKSLLSCYTTNPDQIECKLFTPGECMVLFTLKTDASDYAKILGKSAHSLRALQSLFREIGKTFDIFIDIRLLKPVTEVSYFDVKPYDDEGADYDGEPVSVAIGLVLSLLCQTVVKVDWKNIPGATAYSAKIPTPISDLSKQSLQKMMEVCGGKARRHFYLEIV